jgi:hypothetical protein
MPENVLNTLAQLPDPAKAAEAWSELTAAAQDAMISSARSLAVQPPRCPMTPRQSPRPSQPSA